MRSLIDAILLLRVGERLEYIDLPRELEGVRVPTEGVQDQYVGRCDLPHLRHPAVDELQLADILPATVEPQVEAMLSAGVEVVTVGNHEPIRLDGVVET